MKQLTYDERREIFSAKCSVKPRELELFYKSLKLKLWTHSRSMELKQTTVQIGDT